MKVYVVTSLIESEEDGAEVNVIGIRKTKKEAYLLMTQALEELKENYEENGIEYNIKHYEDEEDTNIIVETVDEDEEYDGLERVEYNIVESEVE